jgi:phosphate transport system substrate-binding protein
MTDALSGVADLGMFSREITDEEKSKGLWWITVAKDAVVPTINANSPAWAVLKEKGITRKQLEAIFVAGTAKNFYSRYC